jgi:hypothetical protein
MAQVPVTRTHQVGRAVAREEHTLERMRGDSGTLFDRLMRGWLAPFDREFASLRL